MADTRVYPERRIVTATFHDKDTAERAYEAVAARGYKKDDIHVFMSDETKKKYFKDKEYKSGNKALEGAGVGGAVGGAVGATVGGLAAAAAALTVPGIGLVIAGPLAGALAGGATGAASGGIVGSLVGLGIPEHKAKTYESDIKDGGIVVGVEPKNDEDVRYFEHDWEDTYGPH